MGPSAILSVIHIVIITTMLNFNGGNYGLKNTPRVSRPKESMYKMGSSISQQKLTATAIAFSAS